MSNIVPSKENVMRRLQEYYSDMTIYHLDKQIEHIHLIAMPVAIVPIKGEITFGIDAEFQKNIDKLMKEKTDYIKANYSDIFYRSKV